MKIINILYFLFIVFLTTPVWAATYYVASTANGGSDTNNGLSGDDEGGGVGPWETIAKVNATISGTGDDVYFLCGDTFSFTGNSVLQVDWTGTSGDHVNIGAYYMVGSVETIGVNGDGRPTIDGPAVVTGAYPSWSFTLNMTNRYKANVTVGPGYDYIDVANLHVQQGAYGVWIEGDYCSVVNVYAEDFESDGIHLKNSTDSVISQNTIHHCCRVFTKGGGANDLTPANLGMTNTDNGTFSGNLIINSWGEGIGYFYGSDSNTFEKNILYNSMRAGIYNTGGCNYNIIKYNLVYGTNSAEFSRYSYGGVEFPGSGLWSDDESDANIASYGVSGDNEYYGNIVVATRAGFRMSVAQSTAHADNILVYNNTFIANYIDMEIVSSNCSKLSGNLFKNNITWNPEGFTQDSGWGDCSGTDFDYNQWASTPGTYVQGANDVTGSISLSKTTGYHAISAGSLNISDVAAQSDNGGIKQGYSLGSPYNYLFDPTETDPRYSTLLPQSGNYDIGAVLFVESGGNPSSLKFGDCTNCDYTGTFEDAGLPSGGYANNHYYSTSRMYLTGPNDRESVIRIDLSSLSQTVSSATLYIYQTYCSAGGNVTAYAEADSWDQYVTYNCASDQNNDGSCDTEWTGTRGKGASISSTTAVNTNIGEYKAIPINTAIVNAAAGGTLNMLLDSDTIVAQYATSDDSDSAIKPYLEVNIGSIIDMRGVSIGSGASFQ